MDKSDKRQTYSFTQYIKKNHCYCKNAFIYATLLPSKNENGVDRPPLIFLLSEQLFKKIKLLLGSTEWLLPPTVALLPPTVALLPPTVALLPPTVALLPPTVTLLPPTVTLLPPTVTLSPPTVTLLPPTERLLDIQNTKNLPKIKPSVLASVDLLPLFQNIISYKLFRIRFYHVAHHSKLV